MKNKLKQKLNKRGSYLVEGAIVIPIFLIATVVLISLINVYASFEKATYEVCDEISKAQASALYDKLGLSIKADIKDRIETDRDSTFRINSFDYLYSDFYTDDLIRISFKKSSKFNTILSINDDVHFTQTIVARGFTGKKSKNGKMSKEEFLQENQANLVYVFISEGKKYHGANCYYITNENYRKTHGSVITMDESEAIERGLTPCLKCNGRS
ncbi:MAG: hypothetical protein HUJ63_12405 [Enterococcus sp.]|nr:hypothetical protein [Enterococcus sp.]